MSRVLGADVIMRAQQCFFLDFAFKFEHVAADFKDDVDESRLCGH